MWGVLRIETGTISGLKFALPSVAILMIYERAFSFFLMLASNSERFFIFSIIASHSMQSVSSNPPLSVISSLITCCWASLSINSISAYELAMILLNTWDLTLFTTSPQHVGHVFSFEHHLLIQLSQKRWQQGSTYDTVVIISEHIKHSRSNFALCTTFSLFLLVCDI